MTNDDTRESVNMTRDEMVEDTARKLFAQAWAMVINGNSNTGGREAYAKLLESHLPDQFKIDVGDRIQELIEEAQKRLKASGGGD